MLDQSQETARDALTSLEAFLGTVDLMNVTPGQYANFILSERSTIEVQIKQQVYVWSADYRIWNNMSITD